MYWRCIIDCQVTCRHTQLLCSYLGLTKQHKKIIDAVGECFCAACAPVPPDIRGREMHDNIYKKKAILITKKKINFLARSLNESLQKLVEMGHLQGKHFPLPSNGIEKQVEMERCLRA